MNAVAEEQEPVEDTTDHQLVDDQGLLTEEAAQAIRLNAMSRERADAIKKGTFGKAKYANGRRAVLGMLDAMMARTKNIQKVHDAMQERLDVDPVGFIKEVVMPLMPKTMLEDREDLDSSKDGTHSTVVVLPDNGRALTDVSGAAPLPPVDLGGGA